jgi:hypothetical protein
MKPHDATATQVRPLNRPRPVHVVADAEGRPIRVRNDREWRAVTSIRESWRIDDEWWRLTISRAYYAVVLDEGRLVTLYRDLVTGEWFLQAH